MSNRKVLAGFLAFCCVAIWMAFRPAPVSDVEDDEPPKLTLPPGFEAEILHHPTATDSSSWVALAFDDRGRLLASDQHGALYRIHPAALGEDPAGTTVERLDLDLGHAQGLLWAHNSLYALVNSEEGVAGRSSGLYRVFDTDGDDQFDDIRTLATFEGWGEHGPHSIILGPDGASLYFIAGNHTDLPETYTSLVPPVWQEDALIPTVLDPRGHASDRKAPGGWVARIDSMGQHLEILSVGYRNAFDLAFNEAGDLFTFDSDMEWDLGMPWYRPIRVCHVAGGSEFGWRTGSGKWPAYYPDALPSVVDIGQGSPTGILMGTGAAFPQRYQRGLFVFDWSFGTIYWVDLQPEGASYTGKAEEFLSGVPLPVTDGVIGPDGALYFATGGRRLDSYLFRVSYTGEEETGPAAAPAIPEAQRLRRSLEALHGRQDAAAIEMAWPHLNHADRFIRYAARIAVESQPVATWQERALREPDPIRRLHAVLALARHANAGVRADALDALLGIDYAALEEAQRLDLLRAYGVVFLRLGAPEGTQREAVVAALVPHFPASSDALNRELGRVLAYLEAPGTIGTLLTLLEAEGEEPPAVALLDEDITARSDQYGEAITNMRANPPGAQEIDYVLSLSTIKAGWTSAEREVYFTWFYDALRRSGGRSYVGFLENIRANALDHVPAAEQEALAPLTGHFTMPAVDLSALPKPEGPGKNWNRKELGEMMWDSLAVPRNLAQGRKLYAAALCQACHTFRGTGGNIGPDLTQIGTRFSRHDILEAIDSPSDAISDQYAAALLTRTNGTKVVGHIVGEDDAVIRLSPNPYAPGEVITLPVSDVQSRSSSTVSVMPPRLFNRLNGREVMDLMAYLLSGGDPEHPCYTDPRGCRYDEEE